MEKTGPRKTGHETEAAKLTLDERAPMEYISRRPAGEGTKGSWKRWEKKRRRRETATLSKSGWKERGGTATI